MRLKTPGNPPTIPGPAVPPSRTPLGGGVSPASGTHCVCGRRKLKGSGHLPRDPVTVAITQRLETIRESRITITTTPPIDLPALAALHQEEQELRAKLVHIAHAK